MVAMFLLCGENINWIEHCGDGINDNDDEESDNTHGDNVQPYDVNELNDSDRVNGAHIKSIDSTNFLVACRLHIHMCSHIRINFAHISFGLSQPSSSSFAVLYAKLFFCN